MTEKSKILAKNLVKKLANMLVPFEYYTKLSAAINFSEDIINLCLHLIAIIYTVSHFFPHLFSALTFFPH